MDFWKKKYVTWWEEDNSRVSLNGCCYSYCYITLVCISEFCSKNFKRLTQKFQVLDIKVSCI